MKIPACVAALVLAAHPGAARLRDAAILGDAAALARITEAASQADARPPFV